MAIGIKSYTLNRANGRAPVDVTLWEREKGASGPRYWIGVDNVEFDGLSIDGARKVASALVRFAALAEKKLAERAALARAKKLKKAKKGGV